TAESQLKYVSTLFKKAIMLHTFITLNTVQNFGSFIPALNHQSYLQYYSAEQEVFYHLVKPLTFCLYAGIERDLANNLTSLNKETGKPVNQYGTGIGAGADWQITKNTGLFFRQRWFNFHDKGFQLSAFHGNETRLELKIFF